jgi:hypothetical protein
VDDVSISSHKMPDLKTLSVRLPSNTIILADKLTYSYPMTLSYKFNSSVLVFHSSLGSVMNLQATR